MKKHEAFYIGFGTCYLLEKHGGNFILALSEYLKAKKRLLEIERARVVDVFGDEIK